MTWTKLSDDFGDDCWTLTDTEFRTHVEGLGWSNRRLLDCRLPKADLARYVMHPEAAPALVAKGWWEDVGDAYQIIHHAGYQRPRAAVLRQQKANRGNGRQGAYKRWGQQTQPQPSDSDSLTDSPSESFGDSLPSSHSESLQNGESLSELYSETDGERDGTGYVLNSRDSFGEGVVTQSGTELGASTPDPTESPPPSELSANGEPPRPRPRCARHAHLPDAERGPDCLDCRDVRIASEAAEAQAQSAAEAERAHIRTLIDTCPNNCDQFGRLDDLSDCPMHPNFRQVRRAS